MVWGVWSFAALNTKINFNNRFAVDLLLYLASLAALVNLKHVDRYITSYVPQSKIGQILKIVVALQLLLPTLGEKFGTGTSIIGPIVFWCVALPPVETPVCYSVRCRSPPTQCCIPLSASWPGPSGGWLKLTWRTWPSPLHKKACDNEE